MDVETFLEKCRIGCVKSVNAGLVTYSLNPNECLGYDGRTALSIASYFGHLDIVALLLEKKADLNLRSEDGTSALLAACAKGHHDIVEVLLENGACSKQVNLDGNCGLHLACYYGHAKVADSLLQRDASLLSIKDEQGMNALDVYFSKEAIKRQSEENRKELFRVLRKYHMQPRC